MGTAKELLEKHKGKYAKKAREKAREAVDKVNRKLAKHGIQISTGQVEKASEDFRKTIATETAARAKAVANDKAAQERTTEHIASLQAKAGSRADLMAKAKTRGIKYFRILNKEELANALHPDIKPEALECIIRNARTRWQAGFGSKKKEPANVPA